MRPIEKYFDNNTLTLMNVMMRLSTTMATLVVHLAIFGPSSILAFAPNMNKVSWSGIFRQAFVSTSSSTSLHMTESGLGSALCYDSWTMSPASVQVASGVKSSSVTGLWISNHSEIVDTLRSFAVGTTTILLVLIGLALVMANIIIPAAARELEKECLELAPDLWTEYQAKLEPGQTIANRPDLMQELGGKLQPLLDAKIAKAEQDKGNLPSSSTNRSDNYSDKTDNGNDNDEAWTNFVDLSAITDWMDSPSKKRVNDKGDQNDDS